MVEEEGDENVEIADVYYLLKSLKYLGYKINPPVENDIVKLTESVIKDEFNPIQNGAGVKLNEYKLLTAYRILSIYDILGMSLKLNEGFEPWIINKWQNWSSDNIPEELPGVAKTHQLLQLVGYSNDEILTYWDCSQVIKSYLKTLPKEEKLDFIALEAIQTLLAELELNQTFPESVIKKLAKSQNRDGGFSITNNSTSDCRGTYIVLDILSKHDALNRIDLEAVENFILFHTVLDGGYSLHYQQDPGFDQTFAVYWFLKNAPDEWSRQIDIQETSPNDIYPDKPFTPKELFKAKTIHNQIGGALPTVEVDDFVDTYLNTISLDAIPTQDLLENVYYSLQLDYSFSTARYRNSMNNTIINSIIDTRNANGGFGEKETSSILETYYAVYSLRYIGHQLSNNENIVNWLYDHQNEDGGFGKQSTDNSVSDIVSTYFAIRTLMTLGADIENHQLVHSWVNNLRHVNGGWAKYSSDIQQFGPRIRFSVLAADLLRRLGQQTNADEAVPYFADK